MFIAGCIDLRFLSLKMTTGCKRGTISSVKTIKRITITHKVVLMSLLLNPKYSIRINMFTI